MDFCGKCQSKPKKRKQFVEHISCHLLVNVLYFLLDTCKVGASNTKKRRSTKRRAAMREVRKL